MKKLIRSCHKRFGIIVFSNALLLTMFDVRANPPQINPDATAFQNNPAHDGSVVFQNFTTMPSKLWSINLGHRVSYPVIAQGEVYVTAGDRSVPGMNLYALNANSGHIDWSVALNPTFWDDTPTYDNGMVFVVDDRSSTSSMNAYDASTGAQLWSRPLVGQYGFSGPATASNGTVYVTGNGLGGTLYAVRESDGCAALDQTRLAWRYLRGSRD